MIILNYIFLVIIALTILLIFINYAKILKILNTYNISKPHDKIYYVLVMLFSMLGLALLVIFI